MRLARAAAKGAAAVQRVCAPTRAADDNLRARVIRWHEWIGELVCARASEGRRDVRAPAVCAILVHVTENVVQTPRIRRELSDAMRASAGVIAAPRELLSLVVVAPKRGRSGARAARVFPLSLG